MKSLWPFTLPRRRKRRRGGGALMAVSGSPTQAPRRRADGTVEARPPWWVRVSPVRVWLGAGTTVVLSLLLCIHLWPSRISLREGDISDREVIAQRTVRYEDTEETRRLQRDAAARV